MVAIANGTLKSCGRLDGLGHQSTFETTKCVYTLYSDILGISLRVDMYIRKNVCIHVFIHAFVVLDVDMICLDVDMICIYVCMYI